MPASTAYMADITTPQTEQRAWQPAQRTILARSWPCADNPCFPLVVVPALVDGRAGVYQWDFGLAVFARGPKIESESPNSAVKVRYATRGSALCNRWRTDVYRLCLGPADHGIQVSRCPIPVYRGDGQSAWRPMMCSAAASLFAQSVVVQRTTLPPFRLLQLALPY